MSTKRKARELRKALKDAKFEATKFALQEKITNNRSPRLNAEPESIKKPRVAPHLERENATLEKCPKAVKSNSRFGQHVSWCITKADREEEWSWGAIRDWSAMEWESEISPPLQQFKQLTWAEIDAFSSESGHKMHHAHEIGDLVAEAQERWINLDLEQFDSIFRFRLGGTKRVWGFVVQAHFHFVWWDREHLIYPV